uniref:Uncharacterized protein n=1 Tax=Trypanosoma congolense (strain IL3000) TaxID=1068625 RepID=G0UKQ8_TRYCI|nr:conserved hypothetical protein [Trypanosoma congolense IL3000]
MGHTERHLVFNRREVDRLQRRLMSFLLIFTAVAIAFIVVVASMQTRVATCQTQAAEGIRPLYMHHGTSNTTVRDAIFASLSLIGVRAEPVLLDSGAQNTQLDVFDTTEGTLSTSGFRLVRETGPASVAYWKLLYMDHSVCSPERGISMEALPNVDYEKVTYRVKAIVSNNMRLFLYETNIATKNKERITHFLVCSQFSRDLTRR